MIDSYEVYIEPTV